MAHPNAGLGFRDVIELPRSGLEGVMRSGAAPSREALAGWEFRGYNPPFFARVLGFQKFVKGFWVDEQERLAGYNLFVEDARGGPDKPWVTRGKRHGFYDVLPAGGRWNEFPDAALLDYGSGRNAGLNPESVIRDYLVQVDPENPDVLLGKAYLLLGPVSVFSNFFVLERLRRA